MGRARAVEDEIQRAITEAGGFDLVCMGHPEGPQVNDPQAPEWKRAIDRHLDLWEQIIRKCWAENPRPMTVTSEFGPSTYMPALPYTQQPVADQWQANVYMMNALKQRLGIE